MDNIFKDLASDFIVFLIFVVIVLIILAAMGRFDTFSNRLTKKFRVKKRGRIYSGRILNDKHQQ